MMTRGCTACSEYTFYTRYTGTGYTNIRAHTVVVGNIFYFNFLFIPIFKRWIVRERPSLTLPISMP